MIREIVTIGHPVLRQRAREVAPDEIAGAHVQQLVDDLIDTMRNANGAGIAANQVGEVLRVTVIEVNNNPRHGLASPAFALADALTNGIVRAAPRPA